ncbi:hypothetical protein RTCIAT899_PB01535 (plasmid) [Rhizobium tropici CIAT 899]|nr:hypothetical protein RTCIAT899_PB01535 [Rhizobium tropici CIAT 899]
MNRWDSGHFTLFAQLARLLKFLCQEVIETMTCDEIDPMKGGERHHAKSGADPH